jgi:anti-anti-sigma regulatory factor
MPYLPEPGTWAGTGIHPMAVLGVVALGYGLYVLRRGARESESRGITGLRPAHVETSVSGPAASAVPGVQIYRMGSLFELDALRTAQTVLSRSPEPPRTLVVCLECVTIVDTRGIHTLRELLRRSRAEGTRVLFCGLRGQPRAALARSGLLDDLGPRNLAPDLHGALRLAAERVGPGP